MKIRVCDRPCKTCIFRPGNLMQLNEGRVQEMVAHCLEHDGHIPCHNTLDQPKGVVPELGGGQAVCRGFYDRHKHDVAGLRLGIALDAISFVDAD